MKFNAELCFKEEKKISPWNLHHNLEIYFNKKQMNIYSLSWVQGKLFQNNVNGY